MEENTMTIREATNLWVNRDMSAIPLSVVEKLAKCSDYNDLMEITPPAINDRVYVFDNGEYGEITNYTTDDDGNGIYTIILDNDEEITTTDTNDFEVQRDEYFPMWGTMWSFDDNCDVRWLEDNMQIMANCGFRIYESEDYGYIFGIDGAGYDFYEAHWIPLYKAIGLKWHDNEEE